MRDFVAFDSLTDGVLKAMLDKYGVRYVEAQFAWSNDEGVYQGVRLLGADKAQREVPDAQLVQDIDDWAQRELYAEQAILTVDLSTGEVTSTHNDRYLPERSEYYSDE